MVRLLGQESAAMTHHSSVTRRSAIMLIAGIAALPAVRSRAAEEQVITVHKDPNCGCCSGWVRHLQAAGFAVMTVDTAELEAIKTRLGVPTDLAACHTAQVAGYVIEGTCLLSLSSASSPRSRTRRASRFPACRSVRPAWRVARLNRTTSSRLGRPDATHICGSWARGLSVESGLPILPTTRQNSIQLSLTQIANSRTWRNAIRRIVPAGTAARVF